jgi:hypothetical protein
VLKNFNPKTRIIQTEEDEFIVKDHNVSCTWERSYNFKRKTEPNKKQKSGQNKNLNKS